MTTTAFAAIGDTTYVADEDNNVIEVRDGEARRLNVPRDRWFKFNGGWATDPTPEAARAAQEAADALPPTPPAEDAQAPDPGQLDMGGPSADQPAPPPPGATQDRYVVGETGTGVPILSYGPDPAGPGTVVWPADNPTARTSYTAMTDQDPDVAWEQNPYPWDGVETAPRPVQRDGRARDGLQALRDRKAPS